VSDYVLKAGDSWPPLAATLSDGSGPVNLTTADSVRWIMKSGSTVVSGPCVVADAVNGRVAYAWDPGDTDTAGAYQGEFEVTWNVGEVETFPNDGYVSVQIIADLD
jgi:hypothetical protein